MAKKILVIDDDVEYVDAILNLLDAKGYQAICAHEGKNRCGKGKGREARHDPAGRDDDHQIRGI